MSDTQSKIGKLLSEGEQRDAIHVAVAPVIAARRLRAGQNVGLAEDGRITDRTENPIGIVDPFLTVVVLPNERCWLFLYPNTITSLRHEWVHPAFAADVPKIAELRNDAVAAAKSEIEEIAADMGSDGYDEDDTPMTYERLMRAAEDWIEADEYHVQHGGQRWQEDFPAGRFWSLYAIVTGRPVPDHKNSNFFSCSC